MRQFSTEHLVVLALTAALVAVAIRAPRCVPPKALPGAGGPPPCVPPKALRVAIGGAYLIDLSVHATDGHWDWGFDLPFHLSDVVAIFAPDALWTRIPLLVEVLYFWALTASLQALLTPDLHQTFPGVFFFTYFTTHAGAVIAAC